MRLNLRRMMCLARFTALAVLVLPLFHEVQPMIHASPHTHPQSQESAKHADTPFVVESYYKAKWGHADEFLKLFKKNHYPVLKRLIEKGQLLGVTMTKPRYHATEDGRWDFKVVIVYKNLEAAFAPPSVEDAIKKELFPDQETFLREEARRFEILIAHWDVPLVDVALEP